MLHFAPHYFKNRSEFSLKIPTLFEIRAVRAVVIIFAPLQETGRKSAQASLNADENQHKFLESTNFRNQAG